MNIFKEIQYVQVNLGIISIEVQETCVHTPYPIFPIVFDDTGIATSMASIELVQHDIHCLPDIVTWDEYLIDIIGLFFESYLADLEDTSECIHLLFDEVALTSYVEGKIFDPLFLYPHNHSS